MLARTSKILRECPTERGETKNVATPVWCVATFLLNVRSVENCSICNSDGSFRIVNAPYENRASQIMLTEETQRLLFFLARLRIPWVYLEAAHLERGKVNTRVGSQQRRSVPVCILSAVTPSCPISPLAYIHRSLRKMVAQRPCLLSISGASFSYTRLPHRGERGSSSRTLLVECYVQNPQFRPFPLSAFRHILVLMAALKCQFRGL